MSLIGIDLGSSAIKVSAYALEGSLLAEANRSVPTYRPEPGHSEVDVIESRQAFREALAEVAANPGVRADPPRAISFSSSGREVFPVAADGEPLGRCLMTSDVPDPVNIGNPIEMTILEFAQQILAITGSKSKIVTRPLPVDDPKQRQPDITRARKLLGWEPKVTLKEGLTKTLENFRERVG